MHLRGNQDASNRPRLVRCQYLRLWLLRRRSHPSYNTSPCEAPMAFTLCPYRRFPVQCAVTYHSGPLPRARQDLEPHLYRLASLWPLEEENGPATDFERTGLQVMADDPCEVYAGTIKEENSTTSKLFMRIERSPNPALNVTMDTSSVRGGTTSSTMSWGASSSHSR